MIAVRAPSPRRLSRQLSRILFLPAAALLLPLAGLCAPADSTPGPALAAELDGENLREIVAEPGAVTDAGRDKAIGFITTNDAYCYQPDASRNECFVNWRLHSVSAGADNMTRLRILLAGRLVVNMSGFFQNSMSYQFGMVNPGGFKVVCGAPSGADPLLGASYNYQVSATDSNNQTANNFGSVQCPAFAP